MISTKKKKSKIFFEVSCPKHGKKAANDTTGTPRLHVSPPKNKREQRQTGCPMCKPENRCWSGD